MLLAQYTKKYKRNQLILIINYGLAHIYVYLVEALCRHYHSSRLILVYSFHLHPSLNPSPLMTKLQLHLYKFDRHRSCRTL